MPKQSSVNEILNGIDVAGHSGDQIAGARFVVLRKGQPLNVAIQHAPQIVSYPLADAGCKIFFGVRTERPDYSYGRNCANRKIQDGNLVVAEHSDNRATDPAGQALMLQ